MAARQVGKAAGSQQIVFRTPQLGVVPLASVSLVAGSQEQHW